MLYHFIFHGQIFSVLCSLQDKTSTTITLSSNYIRLDSIKSIFIKQYCSNNKILKLIIGGYCLLAKDHLIQLALHSLGALLLQNMLFAIFSFYGLTCSFRSLTPSIFFLLNYVSAITVFFSGMSSPHFLLCIQAPVLILSFTLIY